MNRLSSIKIGDVVFVYVFMCGDSVIYRNHYCDSCEQDEESDETYYQFNFDGPQLHEFPLVQIDRPRFTVIKK